MIFDVIWTFLWTGLPYPLGSPAETGCTVRSWSDSTRSVSVSWTCHPMPSHKLWLDRTHAGKESRWRREVEIVEHVGCWSMLISLWLLVPVCHCRVVMLHDASCITVCYHVVPVLTSRSCRSQEIIRGAIHWLRRVCVCVAIDGMHRIAIFIYTIFIDIYAIYAMSDVYVCLCVFVYYLFICVSAANNWSSLNDSMILNWRQGLADSHFLSRNSQYFRLDTFTTTGRVAELNLGKKPKTRTNFRRNLLVCHRLLVYNNNNSNYMDSIIILLVSVFWNSAASKDVPLWLPLCQGCLIDPRWGTKLLWDFFVTCQCLVHAGTQIMSLNSIQGLESKNCLF